MLQSVGAETARGVRMLRHGPRVLMYHFFGTAPPSGDPDHLFVSEPMLTAQLDVLWRGGWQPLSLDQYLGWLDGRQLPKRCYLVTIDDAHESAVRIAAPLLAARGIPSVLFVPSGMVGTTVAWGAPAYQQEPIATPQALRSLAGTGMELGVHGYDHTRMVQMDAAVLRRHVNHARDELVTLTGIRPRAFAYPYGTHDETSRQALAQAGYQVGFAVAREHGRFAKWRIAVDGNDSLGAFRCKLTAAYGLASLAAGRVPRLRHRVRAAVTAANSLRR
jgi:peptidoglycan/xylan/chitin deacetylase (PgdA/CDA1 family)